MAAAGVGNTTLGRSLGGDSGYQESGGSDASDSDSDSSSDSSWGDGGSAAARLKGRVGGVEGRVLQVEEILHRLLTSRFLPALAAGASSSYVSSAGGGGGGGMSSRRGSWVEGEGEEEGVGEEEEEEVLNETTLLREEIELLKCVFSWRVWGVVLGFRRFVGWGGVWGVWSDFSFSFSLLCVGAISLWPTSNIN